MDRLDALFVVPPFFRLLGSHNNRVWPGFHSLSQAAAVSLGVKVWNCDWEEGNVYADWESIASNFWHLEDRLLDMEHEVFDQLAEALLDVLPGTVVIAAGDIVVPSVDLGCVQSVAAVAEVVRDVVPDAYVIGYGPLAQVNQTLLLGDEVLDAVLVGEGENVIVDVLSQYPRGVVNSGYLTANELDALPLLDPGLLIRPVQPIDYDYVSGARGCVHRCSFCLSTLLPRRIRAQSPERFVSECAWRMWMLGTPQFYVQDLYFTADRLRTAEVCRLWKRMIPGVPWYCDTRVSGFDNEMADLLADSGCTAVKFGVEWTVDDVSSAMNKKAKYADAVTAIGACRAAGMKAIVYVLLGGLGFSDDPAKRDEQYDLMYERFAALEADHYTVGVCGVYPGTPLGYELDVTPDFSRFDTHLSGDWEQFWGIDGHVAERFNCLNSRRSSGGVGLTKEDAGVRQYIPVVLPR